MAGLRVVGGEFGGRILRAPKGMNTRPTSMRVREALFNMLADRVHDACVADCFAGSGVLGFEALSRGAQTVHLYESSAAALRTLHDNAALLGVSERVSIVRGTLPASLRQGQVYDLVFMDPPWGHQLHIPLLERLQKLQQVAADSLVILEERRGAFEPLPDGLPFQVADQRVYGDTELTLLTLT